MTRQDRDLAIADNLAYVAAVVDEVARGPASRPCLVFSGFSQGVAMAFRAAAASTRPVAGVIAAGGDVPPEIEPSSLERIGAALVCRGERDQFYTPAMYQNDLERLRAARVSVEPLAFDGGHEWSRDVVDAASRFLRERHP
jgi:predicted esterase